MVDRLFLYLYCMIRGDTILTAHGYTLLSDLYLVFDTSEDSNWLPCYSFKVELYGVASVFIMRDIVAIDDILVNARGTYRIYVAGDIIPRHYKCMDTRLAWDGINIVKWIETYCKHYA